MTDQQHKHYAVEYNKRFWQYFTKGKLSDAEKLDMLNAAYASLAHWKDFSGGNVLNEQRGEYLVSKSWLILGRRELAQFYADRCLKMTQKHPDAMQDFDFAFALELQYKCAKAAGDTEKADEYFALAKSKGDAIKDKGDRDIFFGDLSAAV